MLSGMYLKLIGAGLIVAVVLGGVWYVDGLQDQITELTEKKIALETQISTQNAAIETWKAEADARLKAGEAALLAAQAETAVAKNKATIIYKWKPSTPGDDCKSALDLINGVAP